MCGNHTLVVALGNNKTLKKGDFICFPPSDVVPEELAEPLYKDQYNQEHLKPPVACLLQSAELYCRAGSLILRSDAVKPLVGHNAVIQALAQKGLYVTDQDRLVTERDLMSTPIHMVSGCMQLCKLVIKFPCFSNSNT